MTIDAYTTIVRALREQGYTVGTTTVGAKASCPAHDDHGRGLELRRRPDGSVLLRCDRCDPVAILHELGLPVDLLDPDPGSRSCDLEPGSFALPNAPASEEPEPTSRADGLPAIPTAASAAPSVPTELPDLGPRLDFHNHRYVAPDDLTAEQWTADATVALDLSRSIPWVVGDLVNVGLARFEDVALQLLPDGLASETITKYARIAAKIPPKDRFADVSFSQHALVAYRPEPERRELLERSAVAGWTTADLRVELRQRRQAVNPQPEVEDPNPQVEVETPSGCPTCGRPYEQAAA